jgi:diguanylate cyclase
MISTTLLVILGGCILGTLQLVAGIVLGMWLRKPRGADDHRGRQDMLQAGMIAKRLQALADEMSTSVGEHRSQLDQASQVLITNNCQTGEPLAELVVDVIGNIVRANYSLQSKLDTAEHRLEEQAVEIEAYISRSLTDPLTGLPNRREFNDRLEERMGAWTRRREVFSLLLLDVDHFKKLNDQHGHVVGDQVLASIGRALRGAIRREDAVARYGGEEFAILLPSTSLGQAIKVAQKVREAVARATVEHNHERIAITVSGGIATISANEQAEMLIERADLALYAAKEAGRNRAFVHDGRECRPADGFQSDPLATGASALVDLIHSPNSDAPAGEESIPVQPADFGSYLTRETISAELAQTCQELRKFLEERGQSQQPASASRS